MATIMKYITDTTDIPGVGEHSLENGVKIMTVPVATKTRRLALGVGQCVMKPGSNGDKIDPKKLEAYLVEKSEDFGRLMRIVVGPIPRHAPMEDLWPVVKRDFHKTAKQKKVAYMFFGIPPTQITGKDSGNPIGATYELPLRGPSLNQVQVVPVHNPEVSQEIKDYIEDLDLDELMPVLIDDNEENVNPGVEVQDDKAGPSNRDKVVDEPVPVLPAPVVPVPDPTGPEPPLIPETPQAIQLLSQIATDVSGVKPFIESKIAECEARTEAKTDAKIVASEARTEAKTDAKIAASEAKTDAKIAAAIAAALNGEVRPNFAKLNADVVELRMKDEATRAQVGVAVNRCMETLRSEISVAEVRAGDVIDAAKADALTRLEDLNGKIESYRNGSNTRQDLGVIVATFMAVISSTGIPASWQDAFLNALMGVAPGMQASCSAAAAIAP